MKKINNNLKKVLNENNQAEKNVLHSMLRNKSFQKYLKGPEKEFTEKKLSYIYQKIKDEDLKKDFLLIVEHYSYYPISAYPELFHSAYYAMKKSLDPFNNIFWLPTEISNCNVNNLEKSDNLKFLMSVKSSEFMIYFSKGIFNLLDFQKEKRPKVLNKNPVPLSRVSKKKDDRIYVILDDFVGEGTQIIDAIKEYKLHDIHIDAILTLAILDIGKKNIISKFPDIPIFSAHNLQTSETLKIPEEHIRKISNCLGVRCFPKCNSFVSLHRTPNNTINFFRSKKTAPFKR